jgi:AcrR family transcriptional regulator
MPKVVDHDQRRREVAEVVLQLVAAKGVAAVTLNDVAEASHWSRGVLTHYFGSKGALLEAALRQGIRDMASNLQKAATEPDTRKALRLVLEEVLPLDERRLAFARVHGSFLAEAMVTEHLRPYFAFHHQAWRDLIATLIDQGRAEGEIDPAVDPATAADVLAALTEATRMRILFEDDLTATAQRNKVARWVDDVLPPPP